MRKLIAGALLAAAAFSPFTAAAQDDAPPSYAQAGAATAPVSDAYFAAYIGRDWDKLETLIAEQSDFQDPTATLIFGGIVSEGSAAMMDRFRNGYSSLTHMEFATTRRLISGHVALYEGELDWGIDLGDGTIVNSVTPMVIVLTVEEGKVVHHRDYVDYAPFVAAIRAARAEAG